jgi:hypothetical protein
MRRLTLSALAAGVLAIAAPAAAQAASVRVDSGSPIIGQSGPTMWYDATAGVANHVTLNYASGLYIINDTAETITPGAGCATTPDPNTVTCAASGLSFSKFELSDMDDTMTFQGTGPGVVILDGDPGNDVLTGGDGADMLWGSTGNDTLDGGAGGDYLDGGTGADVISGGAGSDTVHYDTRLSPVSVSLDGLTDDGEAGEGDNVMPDTENVVGGTAGDSLTGSAADNVLQGGPGDDTLDGGAGVDSLAAGDGNDTLLARDGAPDLAACDAGTDSVVADASDQLSSDCENVDLPAPAAAPAPAPEPDRPAQAPTFPVIAPLTAPLPTDVFRGSAPVRASAPDSLSVRVSCPASHTGGCEGTLVVELVGRATSVRRAGAARRGRTQIVKLASRKVKVAAGKTKTVKAHLSRRGRSLLAPPPAEARARGRKRVTAVHARVRVTLKLHVAGGTAQAIRRSVAITVPTSRPRHRSAPVLQLVPGAER